MQTYFQIYLLNFKYLIRTA